MFDEIELIDISETESSLLSTGVAEPMSSVSVSQINAIIIILVTYCVWHIVHNAVGRMAQIGGR